MGIAKKLEEVKSTCFALKKYDKSSFNRGVDDASISKWENKNALTIPDELKILLSISNGFQVLVGQQEYSYLMTLGIDIHAYLMNMSCSANLSVTEKCFVFMKNKKIVAIYNGVIKDYSVSGLLDYCLDQCLDGIFMSDADISGLSVEIQSTVQRRCYER